MAAIGATADGRVLFSLSTLKKARQHRPSRTACSASFCIYVRGHGTMHNVSRVLVFSFFFLPHSRFHFTALSLCLRLGHGVLSCHFRVLAGGFSLPGQRQILVLSWVLPSLQEESIVLMFYAFFSSSFSGFLAAFSSAFGICLLRPFFTSLFPFGCLLFFAVLCRFFFLFLLLFSSSAA